MGSGFNYYATELALELLLVRGILHLPVTQAPSLKKKSTWTLISLSCVIHVHFLSVPPSEHDLGFISRVPSAHLSEERCWLSKSISCLCSFPVQADLCTAARMIWKNVSLFIALLCLLIFNKMETIRPCLIWSATFYLHSHSLLLLYKLYLQLFLQHGCFFSA